MSKMIQVRNVPDRLHKELRRRAKVRDQSLSDYVRKLIDEDLSHMLIEEWEARVKSRGPIPGLDGAKLIREVRQERDAEMTRRVNNIYRRPSKKSPGRKVSEDPP